MGSCFRGLVDISSQNKEKKNVILISGLHTYDVYLLGVPVFIEFVKRELIVVLSE